MGNHAAKPQYEERSTTNDFDLGIVKNGLELKSVGFDFYKNKFETEAIDWYNQLIKI